MVLRNNLLSTNPSCTETCKETLGIQGVDSYSAFSIKLEHNIHVGVLKSVRECTVNHILFERLKTEPTHRGRKLSVKL